MKIKLVVHEAEERGFSGEIPAPLACASQGETLDELLANLHEAIAGYVIAKLAKYQFRLT